MEMRAVEPPGNRDQRSDGRRRGCEEAEFRGGWKEASLGAVAAVLGEGQGRRGPLASGWRDKAPGPLVAAVKWGIRVSRAFRRQG